MLVCFYEAFFWPLACGAPSPHQSNALKGVGRRELVTFSEFFACNLHASCIQLTELQRWNSENKISCMRQMLSGFHHWSPVSCMQVACNAMQFSRVSLFYTFSTIVYPRTWFINLSLNLNDHYKSDSKAYFYISEAVIMV